MRLLIFVAAAFVCSAAWSQSRTTTQTTGATISTASVDQGLPWYSYRRFGMNYFSFWEGPNLDDGQQANNELGRPMDDGLNVYHHASVTYSLTEQLNLDLQTRLEHVHTQEEQWRFQGMRIGVSGKLAAGKDWSLKGAANTDIPGLNGRDAREQTTIFNPGLFAGLNYQISPRWSFYSIISPRLYFYQDNDAVTEEWLNSGRSPGMKRKIELRASPTINYAFNDKVGMRAGLDLNFQQFVRNDLNYFRRWPTAATLGPTFSIHRMLNLYTYVQSYPFDGEKITNKTTFLGMRISGVIF